MKDMPHANLFYPKTWDTEKENNNDYGDIWVYLMQDQYE